MHMRTYYLLLLLLVVLHAPERSQQMTRDQLIALTPEWKGERYDAVTAQAIAKRLEPLNLMWLEEPGAMATAHVCASVPNFMIMEWQSYFHTDPMFKEIVTYDGEWVKDGFMPVSEKPGIGVEINEAGMKKYAIKGVPFFES